MVLMSISHSTKAVFLKFMKTHVLTCKSSIGTQQLIINNDFNSLVKSVHMNTHEMYIVKEVP